MSREMMEQREQSNACINSAESRKNKSEAQMRHSGIEWIGEIPKEWNTMFLKNTAKGADCLFIDGDWIESPYITDSGYRYLTTGNVGPLKFKEQGNSYISANSFKILNCTEVFPGDLLIARLNEPIARTCFVPDMGCPIVTAVDNVIYRPNKNMFFKGFMLYMLNCPGFTENANLLARGSTMHRLSRTMLGNMKIIVPPLSEQQKIANYLDKVCGEVDEMIALQEQMIEELKAYKQSVITEAVTKGLNPDVPMRDSGIDWIGEVPEHWKIVPIKHIKSKEPNAFVDGPFGSNLKSEHFIENGDVLVVESGFITTGKFIFKEFKTISKEHFETIKRSQCKAKDIIIAKIGANYGMAGELPDLDKPSVVSGNSLKITLDNSKMLNTIFVNAMICAKNNCGFIGMVQENAQPALSLSGLNNFKLPVAPIEEQQSIASYLDTKCAEIDALIAIKQAKIEELKDYKKSVIYEYVTGKKEVV